MLERQPASSAVKANTAATMIPNCIPSVEGQEDAYVAEAVRNGMLAVGPHIGRFERAIADFTGARHAIALSNGTAALHLALVVAGVRPGDLVIVPTMTFAATANAIKYCGADPVFFDVESCSWGLDVEQVRHFLEHECEGNVEKASRRRVAAILPVDLYGHPADLDAISELADRFQVPVVEDAAEALGARYKGRRIGEGTRLCCLSFNGNKIITGGNGGMVLTDDETLAKRIRYLSTQAKDDPVEFVHGAVGYNYRMPNINAAVALAQSEKLEEWVARKRGFVAEYDRRFADIDGVSMWRETQWGESSCWMAILTVDESRHPSAVQRLRRVLPEQGIEARPVWLPLHRQAPFSSGKPKTMEVAERIYRTSLCLPCSTGLTAAELDTVASAVIGFFRNGN
jgi:perosamine synthetase